MIRWYDYVFAVLAADIIQTLIFAGGGATTWWEPFLYGGIAGYIIRFWIDFYCQFRLKQERSLGQ